MKLQRIAQEITQSSRKEEKIIQEKGDHEGVSLRENSLRVDHMDCCLFGIFRQQQNFLKLNSNRLFINVNSIIIQKVVDQISLVDIFSDSASRDSRKRPFSFFIAS